MLVLIFIIIASLNSFSFGETEVKVGPELIESKPASNEIDVKIDTEIFLLFSKNVINSKVKDNNKENLKLYDSKGKEVAIEVIFPDDQLEPHRKRELNIKPVEPLKESETYKVVILPGFMSKNGETAGRQMSLTFKTAEKPQAVEEAVDEMKTDALAKTDLSKETVASEETDPISKDEDKDKDKDDELELDIETSTDLENDTADTEEEAGPGEEMGKEEDVNDVQEKDIDKGQDGKKLDYKILIIVLLVPIILYGILRKRNEKK